MDLNRTERKSDKPPGIPFRKKIFFLFAGVVLLAAAGYLYVHNALSAASPGSAEKVTITIPKGASTYKIAQLLKTNGLIKNRRAFVYYSRFTGLDRQLKSGKYSLSPSCSVPEMVALLAGGTSDAVVFTVPEGYTVKQIGDLLEKKGLVNRERFDYLIAEGEFPFPFLDALTDLPDESTRLEGYLFPDTYHIGTTSSEKEIINLMLKRFQREMKELQFPEEVAEKGLTLNEAITIASMVEREAKVDEERPVIAGIIFNRLKLGMPLQIDATVQYVLKGHRSKIYYKDLEVESPYNTYRVAGLPPGPIGSPGRKSLQAVLEPANTDYLYYVAKPDGTHAFAKTLREHNANVRKYQGR